MDELKVSYNLDPDTPVSVRDDTLRVDWYNAGEGFYGDYNPNDPSDENLLRFDVYERNGNTWEAVDDASYCTLVPADTDPVTLELLLRLIFREYRDAMQSGSSVRRLGEQLSWIHPNDARKDSSKWQ